MNLKTSVKLFFILISCAAFDCLAAQQQQPLPDNSTLDVTKTSNIDNDCRPYVRKFCKLPEKTCGSTYISYINSPKCREISTQNLLVNCKQENPKLYDKQMECSKISNDPACPKDVSEININNLNILYSCTSLHKKICKEICGKTYKRIDIRALDTKNNAILCIDDSLPETEPKCSEVYEGGTGAKWCRNYNITYNNTDLQKSVICTKKMKPKDSD